MFLWALLGFLVGWLINLAGDVWPRRLPITLPPRCLTCNTPRAPLQWVGMLAYLLGQSKCLQCNQRLSWRWLLVEFLTPLLFAFLFSLFGFSPSLLLVTFYSSILLLICVTDFEHRLILNKVTFPAIACAIGLAFVTPYLKPFNALLGGLIGFLLTGLIYWGGVWFARRKRLNDVAFGQGDVVLMTFIGFIVGIDIIRAIIIGAVLGGLVASAVIVVGFLRKQNVLYMPYAYGPYLALGGWLVLLQVALEKMP